MIYLDNGATTFPKPACVYDDVDYVQRNLGVNVGRGAYRIAREALDLMETTRLDIARLVGAMSAQSVVFTPSATVALNEIIYGLEWDGYRVVYISPFEHNAVARPLEKMRQQHGFEVEMLPMDEEQMCLDMDATAKLFAQNPPDYVFLNHVSNVTGYCMPLAEMVALAKSYNAIVVVDGAQSLGLIPVNLRQLEIDYLVFAGHKNLYGMLGIGGFVVNGNVDIRPIFAGGTGTDSLRLDMPQTTPGGFEFASPNIGAIASLHSSLQWIQQIGMGCIYDHKKKLLDMLLMKLGKMPKVKVYAPKNQHHHTSILSLNVQGYEAHDVGLILDNEYDIAVRTGYHCAPYIHKYLGSESCGGTVRLGLSYFNDETQIESVCKAISEL